MRNTWYLGLFVLIVTLALQKGDIVDNHEDEISSTHVPRLLSSPAKIEAVMGDSVTLPCEVDDLGDFVLVWKTGKGQVLFAGPGVKITRDARFSVADGETSLHIAGVLPKDRGEYVCQLSTIPPIEVTHVLDVKRRTSAAQRCPNKSDGWIDLGGDFCYIVEREHEISWMDAVYSCYEEGGSLASFHSSEETQRILNYAKHRTGRLHIGLWKHNDGSFEWVDKTAIDYRNWDQREPSHREEMCVELYTENGRWNDIPCDKTAGYVCSSLKGEPPRESGKVCPGNSSDWNDFGGDACYIIEADAKTTWDEALSRCSERGGSLASFHSVVEISVLLQHTKNYYERMHIGLKQTRDDQFKWADKSPFDLQFWNFGEPNDADIELCGEIYPGSGKWNDIPCDKIVGYICSVPKEYPGTSPAETAQVSTTVTCGGNLSSHNGTISSPHYPANYGPNENCLWEITVDEHHQIALHFQTIKVEYGADCEFDYIEILGGHEADSAVIRKICGSGVPLMVLAPGNKAAVKFVSDGSNEDTGFLLDFAQVEQCGGNIVSEEGVLQTRHHPGNYWPNEICTWKIRAPDGNKILFRFQSFDLEPDNFCNYDYVEILDGHDESDSTSLGKFCGNDIPRDIISSGHKITVRFASDFSKEYSGFSAEFKKADVTNLPTAAPGTVYTENTLTDEGCGESIVADRGIILSPNYPNTYSSNQNCLWKITVPEGYQVIFKFKTFSLESSSSCDYDYVEFYNGIDYGSPVLAGKYCGRQIPPQIVSAGNKMSMRFRTDSSGEYNGFAASFRKGHAATGAKDVYFFQQTGCGESVTAEEGVIQSPNYPENYGPNERCAWKITVPEGHQVSLKFLSFNVEIHDKCNYDYVEVADGSGDIAKLCGYELPEDIRSSGNELMITFNSDSTSEYSGFSAEFKKVVPVLDVNATAAGRAGACGGIVESESGTFHSPNYPEHYLPFAECTWVITVPEGYQVLLTFQAFEVEYDEYCKYDYVKVFDGTEAEENRIGIYCGAEVPRAVYSSQNKITVKFVTDESFENQGFSANFTKVEICEEDIVAEEGVIQTRNYPNNYEPLQNCIWHITLPENSTVFLKFLTFNVDSSSGCKDDAVTIYDGYNSTSGVLGRYCGSTIPRNIYSSGNQLAVVFTSDDADDPDARQKGFSAEFKQDICGGNISAESGFISSDNYPYNYRDHAFCTWRITLPEGSKVVLKFEAFALEGCTDCSCDYVKVLDGHDENSESLGQFCGSSLPPTIRSSTEKMSVVFGTDVSVRYSGFKARFSKDACGGDIVAESGIISSPLYPDSYGVNENCVWNIAVPENQQVVLRFRDFELEGGYGCNNDYVEIYDGHGPDSDRLGRFCGSDNPGEIRSSTENMYIRFVSDGSEQRSGFSAEFTKDVPADIQITAMLRELPGVLLKQRERSQKGLPERSKSQIVKDLVEFMKKK